MLFSLIIFLAALEIIVLSAAFCIPILIPIAATSDNNKFLARTQANYTYSDFDNLGMGNIRVSITHDHFSVGEHIM